MKKLLCLIIAILPQVSLANNNVNDNENVASSGSAAELIAGFSSTSNVNNTTQFPVATSIAPSFMPTSDCMGAVSGAAQGRFAGISIGFSKQSKPCNIRAYASQFPRYSKFWWGIMCQDKIIKKADKLSNGGNCKSKSISIQYTYPNR